MSDSFAQKAISRRALIVDANLLVLFVVGSVNIRRISIFKRTENYDQAAFNLLMRILRGYQTIYTTPHVLAEVSNLTDLSGPELLKSREILRRVIETYSEVPVPSKIAIDDAGYARLGLVDAAITVLAREKGCEILTDDFGLYVELARSGLPVTNFTYLRKRLIKA